MLTGKARPAPRSETYGVHGDAGGTACCTLSLLPNKTAVAAFLVAVMRRSRHSKHSRHSRKPHPAGIRCRPAPAPQGWVGGRRAAGGER